jgi:hypothetical protein
VVRLSPFTPFQLAQLIWAGFIGNPVAQAFSRAGHIVYGTTRSSSTAASLDKEEIISVVLDPTTAEGKEQLAKLAKKVDVGKSGSSFKLRRADFQSSTPFPRLVPRRPSRLSRRSPRR